MHFEFNPFYSQHELQETAATSSTPRVYVEKPKNRLRRKDSGTLT